MQINGPAFRTPRDAVRGASHALVGFSNGTLERRYSRIMLSPPQNMRTIFGTLRIVEISKKCQM